jgi:hypothetical protein
MSSEKNGAQTLNDEEKEKLSQQVFKMLLGNSRSDINAIIHNVIHKLDNVIVAVGQ